MDQSSKSLNTFRVCVCGMHGRFTNHDGDMLDRIIVASKQGAQNRLRVLQEYDLISTKDAVTAITAINKSSLPDELNQNDRDFNLETVETVSREQLALAIMLS